MANTKSSDLTASTARIEFGVVFIEELLIRASRWMSALRMFWGPHPPVIDAPVSLNVPASMASQSSQSLMTAVMGFGTAGVPAPPELNIACEQLPTVLW